MKKSGREAKKRDTITAALLPELKRLIERDQAEQALASAKKRVSALKKNKAAQVTLTLVQAFGPLKLKSPTKCYEFSLDLISYALSLLGKDDNRYSDLLHKQAETQILLGENLIANDGNRLSEGFDYCLKGIETFAILKATQDLHKSITDLVEKTEPSKALSTNFLTWLKTILAQYDRLINIMESHGLDKTVQNSFQGMKINHVNYKMLIAAELTRCSKTREAIPYFESGEKSFEEYLQEFAQDKVNYLHLLILTSTCYAYHSINAYNLKEFEQANILYKKALAHFERLNAMPLFKHCTAPLSKTQKRKEQESILAFQKYSSRHYANLVKLFEYSSTILQNIDKAETPASIVAKLQKNTTFVQGVKTKSRTATLKELRDCLHQCEMLWQQVGIHGFSESETQKIKITQNLHYLLYNLSFYCESFNILCDRLQKMPYPTEEMQILMQALEAYYKNSDDVLNKLVCARYWFHAIDDQVWLFFIDCLYLKAKLTVNQIDLPELTETIALLYSHYQYLVSSGLNPISCTKLFFELDTAYVAVRDHCKSKVSGIGARAEQIPFLELCEQTLENTRSMLPSLDPTICENSSLLFPLKAPYEKSIVYQLSEIKQSLREAHFDVRLQSNEHNRYAEELIREETKYREIKSRVSEKLKSKKIKMKKVKTAPQSPIHTSQETRQKKSKDKVKIAKPPKISVAFRQQEELIIQMMAQADAEIFNTENLDQKAYTATIKQYQIALECTEKALTLTQQLKSRNSQEMALKTQYLEHSEFMLSIAEECIASTKLRAEKEREYLENRYQWLKAQGKIKAKSDGSKSRETLTREDAEKSLELCPYLEERIHVMGTLAIQIKAELRIDEEPVAEGAQRVFENN